MFRRLNETGPDWYPPEGGFVEITKRPLAVPELAGIRFPRSMLNGPANERLLVSLGVEIVDDLDAELEDYARAWLAGVDTRDRDAPAVRAVVEALKAAERRRAAR